jgi:hypothetical protein
MTFFSQASQKKAATHVSLFCDCTTPRRATRYNEYHEMAILGLAVTCFIEVKPP